MSAHETHPQDVIALAPIDGGQQFRITFACGTGVVVDRADAETIATDPTAAAAFLRRHTYWATSAPRRTR